MDFDDVTPMVQNIVVMDSDGRRIAVKYFSDEWKSVTSQAKFEKDLFSKINRGQQRSLDGSQSENELILHSVLTAMSEAVTISLRDVVNKKSVLENLDLLLITIDETVDQGLILEMDAQIIAQRVAMRADGEGENSLVGYGEQTFAQALANAKNQLAKSLLS